MRQPGIEAAEETAKLPHSVSAAKALRQPGIAPADETVTKDVVGTEIYRGGHCPPTFCFPRTPRSCRRKIRIGRSAKAPLKNGWRLGETSSVSGVEKGDLNNVERGALARVGGINARRRSPVKTQYCRKSCTKCRNSSKKAPASMKREL